MTRWLWLAACVSVLVIVGPVATVTGTVTPASESVAGGPPDAIEQQAVTETAAPALESGAEYWQGRLVRFDGSHIVENVSQASRANRTFQIRRVNETGSITGLLDTFMIDSTGTHHIDTAGLAGRVTIQYQGDVVFVTDGIGYRNDPADGDRVTANTSAWRVVPQTVSVELADETVYNGQETQLSLRSNREEFTLAVSGRNLTFTDLKRIFPEEALAPQHDARRDADVLRITGGARANYTINVSELDPDTYVLSLDVLDTTGQATTTLFVNEPGLSRFIDIERAGTAGDHIRARVECGQCYLIFGKEDQGVLDVVELQDQTDDGVITLTINTRYVGLDAGAPGVPEDVSVYDAGQDKANRYRNSRELASGMTLAELRADLGLRSAGRRAPIDPGRYELTLAGSDDLIDLPPSDGGELVVNDEHDVRTIHLDNPAIQRVSTLTGPPRIHGLIDPDGVSRLGVPRIQAALGDLLIIELEATGLFGHTAAEHQGKVSAIEDNRAEGIDLVIRNLASLGRNRIDLSRSQARLLTDEANDRSYVLLDTRALSTSLRPVRPGDTYRITLAYTGIGSDRPRYTTYGTPANHRGFPYLPPGGSLTASTNVKFVSPSASVRGLENNTLRVPARQAVEISGTTNVSPQSQLVIRATSPGPETWVIEDIVSVDETGSWTGSLDFSVAQSGQAFTLRISRGGKTLTRVDGLTTSRLPTGPTPGTPLPTATPDDHTMTEHPPQPESPTPTPAASPTNPPTPTTQPPTSGTPSGPTISPGDGNGVKSSTAFLPALPALSELSGGVILVLTIVLVVATSIVISRY